ncbi:hypothetical protein Tco_1577051 [Tanacetum coccineum]
MQTQESKIDTGKAVYADLVDTESIRTDSTVQDESNRSGNDTDADDADIRLIYDEDPMAEVQLTAKCNIFSIGQQHTEQLEIINEGRVDQRESVFTKPDHMIASSESRNSSKNMTRFSSNDMVHNHYLDEARKKTPEINRNSKTNVIPSTRFQSTADGSKPKPRSTNHSTRSLLCVFNANHDACITKLLKEVNSHAKIQSHKTRNSNKPVDQKSHTQKLGRQIFTSHRFSPNKTSAVYEKTSPRSDLSKDESEPTHGSNVDIPNIHESKQTLDLSASTSINVHTEQSFDLTLLLNVKEVSTTDMISMTLMIELESLFGPSFDEYFNGVNQVVLNSSTVTTADASDKRQQQPDLTSSTSTLATTVSADGNFDL